MKIIGVILGILGLSAKATAKKKAKVKKIDAKVKSIKKEKAEVQRKKITVQKLCFGSLRQSLIHP